MRLPFRQLFVIRSLLEKVRNVIAVLNTVAPLEVCLLCLIFRSWRLLVRVEALIVPDFFRLLSLQALAHAEQPLVARVTISAH